MEAAGAGGEPGGVVVVWGILCHGAGTTSRRVSATGPAHKQCLAARSRTRDSPQARALPVPLTLARSLRLLRVGASPGLTVSGNGPSDVAARQ